MDSLQQTVFKPFFHFRRGNQALCQLNVLIFSPFYTASVRKLGRWLWVSTLDANNSNLWMLFTNSDWDHDDLGNDLPMKVLTDNKNPILNTPSHPHSGTIDILHSWSMMAKNWDDDVEASPGPRQMTPAFPPTLSFNPCTPSRTGTHCTCPGLPLQQHHKN